jgi:prepilin-type N-terminal cleavage/methylation domain-containing protein
MHMKRGQKQKGFTIVELLIVIVVIGILAAITVVAFNGIQAKARDAQTESNMSAIAKMMEMYYIDNGAYPSVCGGGDNAGCSANLLAGALVPTYASRLPDAYPTPNSAGVFNYVRGTAGVSYAIYLRFDDKPDCKRGVNVVAGWWGTSLPTC